MREQPGHGLDEYLEKLGQIPRLVMVQHVTRMERNTDGVLLGQGTSLRDLARAVSREFARMEDEEN